MDGSNCRGKYVLRIACASNCESCSSGDTTDCTNCIAGYFAHPSTLVCGSSCPNGYFPDSTARSCLPCDQSCTTCISSSTNCNSCSSQHFPSAPFPASCANCDAACNECSGAGNSNCQACAVNYYPVDLLPSTCVANCRDHASNFYLDGSLCKECASECGTCSGPLNSNCDSCAVSRYEIVGHPSSSPMYCLSSCPSFYFA